MPFRSEKQRRYMFMKHPAIAHRWAHEYGSKPQSKRSQSKRSQRKGSR